MDTLRKSKNGTHNSGCFSFHPTRNGGRKKEHCTCTGNFFDCDTAFGENHYTILLPTLGGGSADVTLDSGGKLLTLQRTLTELAPVLKVYKRPSQRAAFLESLLAVMEELQAYAVLPEQLSESVVQIEGESGDKLRDLSLIYGIYLSKLHAPGHDARDVLEKLEENLEASGYIENKDIFLDGFSYFTGRELRILRILLRRAKSVTVTLLGDTQDRELFSESLRVRERLYALARDAGVACEEEILPQGEVRGALDHIERCFFGAADEFTQPTDAVALYEAGSAYSCLLYTSPSPRDA